MPDPRGGGGGGGGGAGGRFLPPPEETMSAIKNGFHALDDIASIYDNAYLYDIAALLGA